MLGPSSQHRTWGKTILLTVTFTLAGVPLTVMYLPALGLPQAVRMGRQMSGKSSINSSLSASSYNTISNISLDLPLTDPMIGLKSTNPLRDAHSAMPDERLDFPQPRGAALAKSRCSTY